MLNAIRPRVVLTDEYRFLRDRLAGRLQYTHVVAVLVYSDGHLLILDGEFFIREAGL